jgi:prefoldin subunit 5
MKRLLHSLLLCLLLGAPAWAGSELDGPRTEARAARTQVRELRERQQALRSELNTLAGRIESLKAEHKGRLVAGPELESALRRSQELSGQLTGLAQSLAGAESEAERRNLALHTALSEELARVRAAWDGTSEREARAGLIARMRDLRAERDAVRAALPPSQVPALNPAEASDDPEDLLEQADALRDSEDKVRQRLQALRTRITEVREERELDRRMSDFLGEDSIFDEQDRHMRLRRDTAQSAIRVEATPRSRGSLFPGTAQDVSFDQGAGAPVPSESSPQPAPPGTGDVKTPTPYTPPARASDSRPQVDTQRAQVLASGDLDNLSDLEAEATRLESFARELDSRADTLERRARELR